MNFVEELRWRGMLQDIMPGTEELLSKEQVTAYLGTVEYRRCVRTESRLMPGYLGSTSSLFE